MKQLAKKSHRRRYRLNVKKLASVLFLIGFVTLIIVITSDAIKADGSDKLAMTQGYEREFGKSDQTDNDKLLDALNDRVIVIDAGHGGFDPGTIGTSGVREDVLNLAIAQQLKTEFEDNGAQVIMTRSDENALAQNKDDDMKERGRIIDQSRADMVISIHNNWFNDPQVSGPLVIFMQGSEQGKKLAESVQESMNTALGASGTARSQNLLILKSGNQPSILVECGYLSNEEEESKLQQTDHQQKIVKAILEGVRSYMIETFVNNAY